MSFPNPKEIFPNKKIPSLCFIKPLITRKNIIVGEFSYYDDPIDPTKFESKVTHHYEFLGDKLIIGKFCAIGVGIEIIMNGANHRMNSITTYPFNIMGADWSQTPQGELPFKGDTIIGNDVWIGQNVTILPGITIGDGSIIAANSVVSKSVLPYSIVGGNPIKLIRKRFSESKIVELLKLQWWNWEPQKITDNLELLTKTDI